ncbi:MAG: succinate dehydrogenase, hydrophobic membrane anchor protein [Bacteroidota bacterium]
METSFTKAKFKFGGLQSFIKLFQTQAQIRGWPFLAAWAHRITGVMLVLYVWFHIFTLSALSDPDNFNAKMKIFAIIVFVFLEWLLSLPVIYHALNGGRLILYEVFQNRRDETVLKWVMFLSIVYTLLLAIFMVIGNQTVSAAFFWSYTAIASGCVTYITVTKVRISAASLLWKLQRISGAFIFLMVPAHMLFMHLNPDIGHDAQIIIERMGNPFIKLVDFLLLVSVLYHGAYGLYSITQDYISQFKMQLGIVVVLSFVTLVFAWMGLKLIVVI